jgi:RHS repeat-associated protein
VLNLSLYYCGGKAAVCGSNNGNLVEQDIQVPAGFTGTLSQTYLYDGLNRLGAAAEGSAAVNLTSCGTALSGNNWQQNYVYDTLGNRALLAGGYRTSGNAQAQVGSISGALVAAQFMNGSVQTNRWTGAVHDAAGNVTTMYSGGPQAGYDAEGRIASMTESAMPGIAYQYDGEGRRVLKTVGTVVTQYLYDGVGELVAEYGGAAATGTNYLTADWLGTTRMVTNGAGAAVEFRDYAPFGEELGPGIGGRGSLYAGPAYPSVTPDAVDVNFTGKERDAESGLDYFEARYMSSAQGRFTSTDPIISGPHKLNDPQNWNMYSYARNNPLRFTDPSGEIIEEQIDDQYKKRYEQWKKAYLSTEAGRAQWAKYADDANFTLTITVDKSKGQGAEAGNYQFDGNGTLTAATIMLGPKIGSGYPSSVNYPVTSSLQGANISGDVLAATKFAHEFGHVNQTGQENSALFQLQQQLIPQYNSLFFSNGRNVNDPALKALEGQMGGNPIDISHGRENAAERNTIPYLRDRFPGKSMPSQIRQAIENYQKANPGK